MDRLYWSPDSANLVIRTALHELDLPYEAVLVHRSAGGLRQHDYLALNPQGLLPVLVTPGQDAPLFETGAILLHLADREGRLVPADPAARGRLLKWLFYLSNTLHADLRILFYAERYGAEREPGPGFVRALRAGVRTRIDGHLVLLDRAIAEAGGPWLMGPELTVLDLYLACCVRWAQLYPPGEGLPPGATAPLAALATMLEALAARPAIGAACAREGIRGSLFLDPAMPGPIV
jgi:glutathione S-transferase